MIAPRNQKMFNLIYCAQLFSELRKSKSLPCPPQAVTFSNSSFCWKAMAAVQCHSNPICTCNAMCVCVCICARLHSVCNTINSLTSVQKAHQPCHTYPFLNCAESFRAAWLKHLQLHFRRIDLNLSTCHWQLKLGNFLHQACPVWVCVNKFHFLALVHMYGCVVLQHTLGKIVQ